MADPRAEKKNFRAVRADLSDRVRQNYRLARALPEFFHSRVTLAQAEEEIKKALESRAERFLDLMRGRVYARPDSPYRKLLKFAGCEFADLCAEVRRRGLEPALEKLAAAGVYLTVDEFKGNKEVRRGNVSFLTSARDFEPPSASPGFMTQSSGTNNAPVRSIISVDRIAIQALEVAIFFSAHDLFGRSHALYDAILPAGSGLRNLLINAKLGIATERWFARKVPTKSPLSRWYQFWSTYLVVVMGKLRGPGFPRPEFIDVQDVRPIVLWLSGRLAAGEKCCMKTTASNATRIAEAAVALGRPLAGTKFILGGEPFTEAKREAIHRAGAAATVHYGFSAGGSVGYGCADPSRVDEVHVNRHTFAVILHPQSLTNGGSPIRPLLFSTLLPMDPRLLLNVENGDYGVLESRDCGCALERAGLVGHLSQIRSYEKFTSEGMNYSYGDLYEIFEKILPAEFGGGPGDYQLVEDEDERGHTRLTLCVHPAVAALDESALLRRLREELSKGSWARQFQTEIWRDAGTFRIRREAPRSSARGKILPLHIARS